MPQPDKQRSQLSTEEILRLKVEELEQENAALKEQMKKFAPKPKEVLSSTPQAFHYHKTEAKKPEDTETSKLEDEPVSENSWGPAYSPAYGYGGDRTCNPAYGYD